MVFTAIALVHPQRDHVVVLVANGEELGAELHLVQDNETGRAIGAWWVLGGETVIVDVAAA